MVSSPPLRPVYPAATACQSGAVSVESAAFYTQTAAAVWASAPGSPLNPERGQRRAPEPRWTDGSLRNKSKNTEWATAFRWVRKDHLQSGTFCLDAVLSLWISSNFHQNKLVYWMNLKVLHFVSQERCHVRGFKRDYFFTAVWTDPSYHCEAVGRADWC